MATDYALASPLDVDEDGSFTINQLRKGGSSAPFERFGETVREYVALFLSSTALIAFLAFVIAICAMDKVNHMSGGGHGGMADHWEFRCQQLGTALYGDDVFSWGGHHYQVVGGHWAQITWRQAEMRGPGVVLRRTLAGVKVGGGGSKLSNFIQVHKWKEYQG